MSTSRRRFLTGSIAGAGAAVATRAPGLARKRRGPLFLEDFDRRDREGWGARWFNQRYGRRWAIRGGRGVYRLPATENGVFYRPNPVFVLDHDVADADLRATVSVSNPTARVGLAARGYGYADYYAAYIGSGALRVSRCGSHHERLLAKKSLKLEADRRYRIRLQIRGTGPVTIRAKAWPLGTPEPREWQVEKLDTAADALLGAGPFGLLFQHATDRAGSTARVAEMVAWSNERRRYSQASIVYSLAGPLDATGTGLRVVAKASLPAHISFEVALDPGFTQDVTIVDAGRTGRAGTASARVDVTPFPRGSVVHWRAVATREGRRVVGPANTFRTPAPAGLPLRIAFGACTKSTVWPRTSFEQARLKLPDLYLHQGDLGYVPHKVVAHAPDTYQDHWVRMLMEPSLASMTREVPFAFYRDDADYGVNQADSSTLRRFTIGAHDELNANPGPYFESRYGDVAVFVIDCRRYSTGKGVPDDQRTKLGPVQKQWLKDSMRAAVDDGIGLLVLASPQAWGSDRSPRSWRRGYPSEWAELIDFFQALEAPVLIVSGDSHGHRLHEYPQKNLEPNVPRIVEFVSAGTEQTRWSDDLDPRIVLKEAKGSGFGIVEIGAEQQVGGQSARDLVLTAIRSSDGTPFWTHRYVIVKGVGILPVGV